MQQPTTTETVHNVFFRNKKSKRNKKQAEPKKRKPNRLGSDFLKEIVHERINQNL